MNRAFTSKEPTVPHRKPHRRNKTARPDTASHDVYGFETLTSAIRSKINRFKLDGRNS